MVQVEDRFIEKIYKLGESEAFSNPSVLNFIDRIKKALPKATDEILTHQESVFKENNELLELDFVDIIIQLNLTQEELNPDIKKRLILIFSEEPVHGQIFQDYPSLHQAGQFLNTKTSEIIKKTKASMGYLLGGSLLLFMLFPGQSKTKRFFSWLPPNNLSLKVFKSSYFIAAGALMGSMLYKHVYNSYIQYKKSITLARLAVQGEGLTDIMQIDSFFDNFIAADIVFGLQSFLMLSMHKGLSKSSKKHPFLQSLKKHFQGEIKPKSSQVPLYGVMLPQTHNKFLKYKDTQAIKGALQKLLAGGHNAANISASILGSVYHNVATHTIVKALTPGLVLGTIILIVTLILQPLIKPVFFNKGTKALDFFGVKVPIYFKKA